LAVVWHALGLLAASYQAGCWSQESCCFSGSLYALALGAPRTLGVVTPIGGLAFIFGWLAFALAVIYARTPG
jgi:uncharacterized membrane protein YgdD (TMEM256/DUF423 family)